MAEEPPIPLEVQESVASRLYQNITDNIKPDPSDLPPFLQKYVTNFQEASSGNSISPEDISKIRKQPLSSQDSPLITLLKIFPNVKFDELIKTEVFSHYWQEYKNNIEFYESSHKIRGELFGKEAICQYQKEQEKFLKQLSPKSLTRLKLSQGASCDL
jgi:hypothetical protein